MWQLWMMYLLLIIKTPQATALDFCSGVGTDGEAVNIVYRKSSGNTHCVCSLKHNYPWYSRTYTVESISLNNADVPGGGFYRLYFASGETMLGVVNKTLPRNRIIFETFQTKHNSIILKVDDIATSPDSLQIKIINDDSWYTLLRISCNSVDLQSTTESTTTLPATTTSIPTSQVRTTIVSTETTTSTQVTTKSGDSTDSISKLTTDISTSSDHQMFYVADNTASIAGGVAGALLVVVCGAVLLLLYWRRKGINSTSKACHENLAYSVPDSQVVYSLAAHVTQKPVHLNNNNSVSTEPEYFKVDNQDFNVSDTTDEYCNITSTGVILQESRHGYTANQVHNEEPETTYNHISASVSQHPKRSNYENVQGRTKKDYDHITLEDDSHSSETSADVYDHVAKKPGDCYNHTSDVRSQDGSSAAHYDTTASAAMAVKELERQDDYYSYNHLGTS